MSTPEIIAGGAAVIALIAAAGSWAAVFTARHNAVETINATINTGARSSRATVVSANRQRWIDALRDDVSLYLAARRLYFNDEDRADFERKIDLLQGPNDDGAEKELEHLRIRIELRLNNTEIDHRELLRAVNQLFDRYERSGDAHIRELTQQICKAEWERLKREAAGTDPMVKSPDLGKTPKPRND